MLPWTLTALREVILYHVLDEESAIMTIPAWFSGHSFESSEISVGLCKAMYPVTEVCRLETEVFTLQTESIQCPFNTQSSLGREHCASVDYSHLSVSSLLNTICVGASIQKMKQYFFFFYECCTHRSL